MQPDAFASAPVTAWSPAAEADQTAQRTRVQARPAFTLMAHRERWGVQNGRIRPILGRIKHMAGLSNVDVVKGVVKTKRAEAHYIERGWTIIPPTTLPPSQAKRPTYIVRPQGRPDVHLAYWEQAFPGSVQLRADEALRDEFLDYVAETLLPPPPIYVLERMRDDARAEYEACSDRAQSVPSYKPLAKAAADRLKLLEAELERRSERETPAASEGLAAKDEE